jgi:hypothetical protein
MRTVISVPAGIVMLAGLGGAGAGALLVVAVEPDAVEEGVVRRRTGG